MSEGQNRYQQFLQTKFSNSDIVGLIIRLGVQDGVSSVRSPDWGPKADEFETFRNLVEQNFANPGEKKSIQGMSQKDPSDFKYFCDGGFLSKYLNPLKTLNIIKLDEYCQTLNINLFWKNLAHLKVIFSSHSSEEGLLKVYGDTNSSVNCLSLSLLFFIGIIFSINKNFVNYEGSFFHQKRIFRIINKNRIIILESILLMQNCPGTQTVTKYPNSHTYPNSQRFWGSRKCDYSETLQ